MHDDSLALVLEDNAELREELSALAARIEESTMVASSEWLRSLTDSDTQTSHGQLRDIVNVCRAHAVANPLIRRGLNLRASYVWGGGFQIQVRDSADGGQDVNAVVQAFLDTPGNQLLEHDVNEKALGTDGGVYFACFTDPRTGAVQVRRLPWDQIVDIITNPEDASEPWYYYREWQVQTISQNGRIEFESRAAYYPALRYRPQVRPKQLVIDGRDPAPVVWDAPVHHMAVNRLDGWLFGLGDAFAAIDWARAYSVFLEDWAKLMKALSMFAWRLTTKSTKTTGIAAKIAAAGVDGAVGATAAGTPDTMLEAIPKTGATIDSESGRPLAAMVAAALDVPVTMLLGDPGTTGARATAETLDRPTEDMAQLRQRAWSDTFRTVVGYVIDQAVKAPAGPLQGTVTRDPYTGREVITITGDAVRTVDVLWPPLDKIDPAALVKAIVEADSTQVIPGVVVLRLLLQALRVDDIDEVLAQAVDEQGNLRDRTINAGQAAVDAFHRGDDPASVAGDTTDQPQD